MLALLLITIASPCFGRCYFLECEPGDAPGPPLAPPQKPTYAPQSTSPSTRPSSQYESCSHFGGYTYCVSSVLTPQYGFTYGPEKIADGRLDTAWVPGQGAHGDGIGEWVLIQFDSVQTVTGFKILNGYRKNANIFLKNNRVQDLEILTSSGVRKRYTLSNAEELDTIEFDSPVRLSWIQFTIQSVYRGSKYRDTAISEIRLLERN